MMKKASFIKVNRDKIFTPKQLNKMADLKDQSPSVPILKENLFESELFRRRKSNEILNKPVRDTFSCDDYDNTDLISERNSVITQYGTNFDPDRKSQIFG